MGYVLARILKTPGDAGAAGQSLRRWGRVAGVALCGLPAIANAEPARLPDETALQAWVKSNVNEQGQRCTLHAFRPHGESILLACGHSGLWTLSADPESGFRLAAPSQRLDGEVMGFFEAEGQVWLKVQSTHARPLNGLASQATGDERAIPPTLSLPLYNESPRGKEKRPPSAAAVAPPAKRADRAAGRVTGRVVRVRAGEVVVSLGTAQGLSSGDRIRLSVEQQDALDGGSSLTSSQPLAVGMVTSVSAQHAKVRLGINESVPLNALAEPTNAAVTSSSTAPPRVAGLWDAELMVRPFVALEELGGGILASATLGYRFASNLRLHVALDPLGLADVQDREGVVAISAAGLVSYDSQFLEMGIGVGGQTVNVVDFNLQPGSGLAIAQLVRLGVRDGLSLTLRSNIVLFHSEFAFGALNVVGQIPVSRGYWFLLSGGGGSVGYGFGELGLRVLLNGNGDQGSTFLTATAGGGSIFRDAYCTEADFGFECEDFRSYGGPMAGIGAEWRF